MTTKIGPKRMKQKYSFVQGRHMVTYDIARAIFEAVIQGNL